MALNVTDISLSPPRIKSEASTIFVLPDCMVGIEIEVEGCRTVPDKLGYWKLTEEPSLRNNGREYVTYTPIFGADIISALDELEYILHYQSNSPKFTERCSLHIHIDCRDMTLEQVFNQSVLYCILERALFKFVGNGREDNIYCVPLYSSYKLLTNTALSIFKRNDHAVVRNNLDTWAKYTAYNINPLVKYGTVEYRHHTGTADKERIITWINLLMCIKGAALTDINWIEYISINGVNDFMSLVFGDKGDVLLPHVTDVDIYRGIRTAQDMREAYMLEAGRYSIYTCLPNNSAYAKYYYNQEEATT